MSEWVKTKLENVITFNPQESIRKNAIAKKIAMENLEPYSKYIYKYKATEFNGGSKFRNCDTLMARITPCLENGKTSQVTILNDKEVGFGSTEYIVLRAKEGLTDKDYVFYLSISPMIRDVAIKSMVGSSGRQRVQINVLKNIEINTPPLPIQRRIAAILSSLDDKIDSNRKTCEKLEEIAQAIFKRWFVDFEFPNEEGLPYKSSGGEMVNCEELGKEIPKGWEACRFTGIVNVLSGGTPKTDVSEYWNGDIPFFTPKDCDSSFYVISTEKNLSDMGLENCNSQLYNRDTIFITARGTVGKVALSGCDMAMNQSCYALKAKDNISQYYIFMLLKNKVNELKMSANGAVFDAIVVDTFKALQVVKPQLEIIKKFDEVIKSLFKKLLTSIYQNKKLTEVRDALLPKLMSGELAVDEVEIYNDF